MLTKTRSSFRQLEPEQDRQTDMYDRTQYHDEFSDGNTKLTDDIHYIFHQYMDLDNDDDTSGLSFCITLYSFNENTSIHRHQTPPRHCHAAHGCRCTVQPPRFGVAPITAKSDVIHNTGSTQRSATLPEEDRATVTGDRHSKFREDWFSGSRDICSRTDRQTDGLITILRTHTGAEQ